MNDSCFLAIVNLNKRKSRIYYRECIEAYYKIYLGICIYRECI